MFALLSASYMLSLLATDPCVSEVYNIPGKNETVAHKCFPLKREGQMQTPKTDPLTTIAEANARQKNPYKKKKNTND